MSRVSSDSQTAVPVAQQIPSRETTASSQMRPVELSEIVKEASKFSAKTKELPCCLTSSRI